MSGANQSDNPIDCRLRGGKILAGKVDPNKTE
jgi:hypothetical protein